MNLRLGRLAPRLLALVLLVEVALRFVPAKYVAYRGWEAVRGIPNRRYENERSYGDLANLGNLPARREYRRDVFTTDGRGYRNPPDLLKAARPAAVLFGDSFAVGAGNPDDDTLSAQLTRRIGAPVYNGATRWNQDVDEWLDLSREMGLERGWVIYEILQNSPAPTPRPKERSRWLLLRPLSLSPMKIWLSRGLRRIEDGVILPNPMRHRVADRRLSDGTPMLFLPDGGGITQAEGWPDLLARRAEVLSKNGLRLLVVMVPSKHQIYGPMLQPPDRSGDAALAAFARLEEGLRRSGIPVVNLAPAFRREAEARLPKGELIYWRDDTHWNGAGIGIAAAEISRVLSENR